MNLFPMERLVAMVNKGVTKGRDFEEIIAEFVEQEFCSPSEASQLRMQFTSSAISTKPRLLNLSLGPASADVSAPIQPSLPKRSAPKLQIDRTELLPNIALSPKFTIQGDFSLCQPLVYFTIDSRICKNDTEWNETPILKPIPNGWYFHQKLQLERVGEYLFDITVIDLTPGFFDPGYYHTTFQINVIDPTERQRRKVVIQANGNLAANLDQFGKDADIEIVGQNVVINARDESILDRMNSQSESENIGNQITTISLQSNSNAARRVPYLSQPDAPRKIIRLCMTESETKRFYLIGGRCLTFGRDVPEQSIWNDIPLAILPGTPEENNHANEFAILKGLFSREHARLEVDQGNVYLVDVQGGTILDKHLLSKGCKTLLFSNDIAYDQPRSALFSKILAMQFMPHCENFLEQKLMNYLPKSFPRELLYDLYSINSFAKITSIGIKPDRHFKQKAYVDTILKRLKSTPLAESNWWVKWFSSESNVNPLYGIHEYWFIPQFVTLGRDYHSKIRLESRHWGDVRLRIMLINHSLYVENISLDTTVEFGVNDDYRPLDTFRPQPLCPCAIVRKGDAVLRFESLNSLAASPCIECPISVPARSIPAS